MKRIVTIAGFLGITLIALAALQRTSPPGTSVQVPVEIVQYYEDLSFAASFSTRDERAWLRLVADVDTLPGISARLRTVGNRLRRLESRNQHIDPGIFIGPAKLGVVPGAELAQMIGVEQEGEVVWVRVKLWPLSPAHNVQLVAEYERQKRTRAPADAFEGPFDQPPRIEVHAWHLVNGKWMRKEAIVALL